MRTVSPYFSPKVFTKIFVPTGDIITQNQIYNGVDFSSLFSFLDALRDTYDIKIHHIERDIYGDISIFIWSVNDYIYKDNLLNLKFGKLTVVKYIGSCKKGALWQCLCECGNSHEVATEFLKNGSSKSCGCINRCRGENHYNFDPSISNEDRLNKRGVVKNPLYTKWREDCLLRDNFTCQLSNQKGGDLCVHHIYSWNSHKQLRFDINNGITLSKLVHDKFHKIYGKGDNNMDQFVDYIKTYYTDFDLEKFLSRSINECKSCEG